MGLELGCESDGIFGILGLAFSTDRRYNYMSLATSFPLNPYCVPVKCAKAQVKRKDLVSP